MVQAEQVPMIFGSSFSFQFFSLYKETNFLRYYDVFSEIRCLNQNDVGNSSIVYFPHDHANDSALESVTINKIVPIFTPLPLNYPRPHPVCIKNSPSLSCPHKKIPIPSLYKFPHLLPHSTQKSEQFTIHVM